MASYDVTDSAIKGYVLVWQERRYLFKLAIFPLLIKFVCAMTVIVNGLEFDFVKQALLMLPSYIADGWVMSHLVRLVYLDQRWPFRPSGHPQNDMAALRDRARGIMAGTICFALVEFLKTGYFGMFFTLMAPPGTVPGQPPVALPPPDVTMSGVAAVLALALMVLTIWSVRYLWLYIPAAAGFSGRDYLKRVGGLMGSVRLLGAWMICAVPLLFSFIMVVSLFLSPFQTPQGFPPALDFLMNALRVAVSMVAGLITTAGMAYVIRTIFQSAQARR